jgi:hypothetical protein
MASDNQRGHSHAHSINTLGHLYSVYGDSVSRNTSPSVPPPRISPAPLSHISSLSQALPEPGNVTPRSLHTPLPPSYSGGLNNLTSSHELSPADRYPGIRPHSRVAVRAPHILNPHSSERPPTSEINNSPHNPRVALPPASIHNHIHSSSSSSRTRVSLHDSPALRIHSPHALVGRIQPISPLNARPTAIPNFSPVSRRIPAAQVADPLFLPSSSLNSPRYPSPASGLRYNYTRQNPVSVPVTPVSRHLDSPFNYPQRSPLAPITSPIASPVQSPALPSLSTPALPNTKNIPLLTGRADWGAWHDGVITLLLHIGVLNHVNGPAKPGTYYPPNLLPTYPPELSDFPTTAEEQVSAVWWLKDSVRRSGYKTGKRPQKNRTTTALDRK